MELHRRSFLISIPEINDVEYFIGVLKCENTFLNGRSNRYFTQIKKTRFLILKYPEIIAAPIFSKTSSEIQMIFTKKYPESNYLRLNIENHGVQLFGPQLLNDTIYNECIHYSMVCRLTPEWNKFGKYFVQDHDFLRVSGFFEGVFFESFLKDGYLRLSIEAVKLKSTIAKEEDFGVNSNLLRCKNIVPLKSDIYVLPHFNSGTLVNLSRDISSLGPFKTFSDIRTYWRCIYGYCLPPQAENSFFAQVLIGYTGILYCYPLCCIRTGNLVQLRAEDSWKGIEKFCNTLMSTNTLICLKKTEITILKSGLSTEVPFSIKKSDSVSLKSAKEVNNLDKNSSKEIYRKSKKDALNAKRSSFRRTCSPPPFFPALDSKPTERDLKVSKAMLLPPIFLRKPQQMTSMEVLITLFPSERIRPSIHHICWQCFFSDLEDSKEELSNERNTASFEIIHNYDPSPEESEPKKYKCEIEDLIQCENLKSATVHQLRVYCKRKMIPVRSKEKKFDMIRKIREYHRFS